MISDSHEGIKAAAAKVLKATWQRCRVHFMCNALTHAGTTQRRMVSAAIGIVFVQDSADAACTQWRSVTDQLRGKFPKLGALMDEVENDVLAFMTSPRAHWTQIYSTNPLELLNAEIKRRTKVVGIFPNDASIVRLVGAMRPGKRKVLDKRRRSHGLIDEIEQLKASVRAKVEHPFRVIKRLFGHVKVRYRGLKKNTAQLSTLFALTNLWMASKKFDLLDGFVRPETANPI